MTGALRKPKVVRRKPWLLLKLPSALCLETAASLLRL